MKATKIYKNQAQIRKDFGKTDRRRREIEKCRAHISPTHFNIDLSKAIVVKLDDVHPSTFE